MDKRTLGTNGLEVSAIGLGCMSMTGGYSDRPDRQEMISLDPHRRGPRRHLLRHRRGLRPVHQRGARRRGPVAVPRRGGDRHQVRVPVRRRRQAERPVQPTRAHQAGRRRVAAAAPGRRDRPLLPAPGQPRRPDRGRRRRGQGTDRGRQGQALRHVRGGRRDDPSGARGPARDGRAERVLAVVAASRGGGAGRPARSWASASCRTARSARASSPARSLQSTSFEAGNDIRTTIPRFEPDALAAQPGRRRPAWRRSPSARAPPRARSPSPGCWPRSRGSSRSPARARSHRLEENIGAADVELSPDELTEIEDAASRIDVQGGRYNEAGERMTNL